MSATALRKELQKHIATLTEKDLTVLKPIVLRLAETEPDFIIEPASPEECKRIKKRVKDYYKNPEKWTTLEELKREIEEEEKNTQPKRTQSKKRA